ncbi:MAG: TRAP transporter small permease [Butyrivibrio sp.]|nr:TRAP transporter small permease [Butyrivibrio sp.]
MDSFFNAVDKIKPAYDVTYKVVLFVCKLLLVADILITSMSVLGRYVSFVPDPSWSEEIVLTLMSYMAVLSAALAIRRGAHIRMTALDRYLPEKLLKILDLVSDAFVLVLAFVMLIVGWQYATTLGAKGVYVSLPKLSRFWMYFPIPVAGLAMIIFELEAIYNHIKRLCGREVDA